MDTQELAQELGHPGAQELLSGAMARLAYNGHDGFPRVIPVGFLWTGERIVVSTAPTSPKARALASRPQVALTIDGGSTPEEAKALLVRGLATLETVDGVTEEYLESARNSMDGPELAEFEDQRAIDVPADGAHLDRAALGPVLRLRRGPAARFSRGSRRRWLAGRPNALLVREHVVRVVGRLDLA